MNTTSRKQQTAKMSNVIWGRTTRLFHWLNVACIFVLAAIGTVVLNGDALGLSSEGKVLLKTIHVYTGYVFALNLLWRLVWAFFGGASARWSALLPFYKGYVADLKSYVGGVRPSSKVATSGHNPLGRLMVSLLLLLLTSQAITGLMLAGTDLYMPPLGSSIAEWVTGGDAEKLANLQPGSREFVDEAKYAEMRAFRKPFITLHVYVFYSLLVTVFLHILGVVIAEFRHGQGLVSSMVTGRRYVRDDSEADQQS